MPVDWTQPPAETIDNEVDKSGTFDTDKWIGLGEGLGGFTFEVVGRNRRTIPDEFGNVPGQNGIDLLNDKSPGAPDLVVLPDAIPAWFNYNKYLVGVWYDG